MIKNTVLETTAKVGGFVCILDREYQNIYNYYRVLINKIMAQKNRKQTAVLSVSLPKKLTRDLQAFAEEQDISVSQLTRDAVKSYIVQAKWRKAQEAFRPVFEKLGIKTDDDVEKYFG